MITCRSIYRIIFIIAADIIEKPRARFSRAIARRDGDCRDLAL